MISDITGNDYVWYHRFSGSHPYQLISDHFQRKHFVGALDLAVEIISPSSAAYDRLTNYETYEQAGIPEYWLVNLKRRTIEVFVLEGQRYHSLGVFKGEQALLSWLIPSGTIPVEQFFSRM